MTTRASLKRKLSVSSTSSQEAIDPQLQQSAIASSSPSLVHAAHAMPVVDGHSTGQVHSRDERSGDSDEEEVTTMVQHPEQSDQDSESVTVSALPPTQKMADVGRLYVMHGDTGDLKAGYHSFYQPRRQLGLVKDNFSEFENYNKLYVFELYSKITTCETQGQL